MNLIKRISQGVLFSSLIGMSFLQGDNLNSNKKDNLLSISKEIFIPEYKRELKNVFMKFQPEIKYQEAIIREVLNYSNINFMLAKSSKKEFESFSKNICESFNKIIPSYYDNEGSLRQLWAQDLFEILITDKDKKIILPNFFNLDNSLNPFINLLKKDSINYLISKNNFEGGHLTYDFFNGQNILFSGTKNDFINSLSKKEKVFNYKKEFGADTIVFLNNDVSNTPLFHIDQCFTFVDSGKIAILDLNKYSLQDFYLEKGKNVSVFEEEFYRNISSADVNGSFISNMLIESLADSKKILNEMKNKFFQLGYEVFSLPASFWQLANYQSYMNSRLFMYERKRKILMPLFPNSEGIYSIDFPKNKEAKEFFENFGLEVIPIENKSWIKQGNIHCLTVSPHD